MSLKVMWIRAVAVCLAGAGVACATVAPVSGSLANPSKTSRSFSKKPNIWGVFPDVVEMQSEGGAAGAVHGARPGERRPRRFRFV